jgi:hypothetical protein
MSRLLKEIKFGRGIQFTILGQVITLKIRRSDYIENAVKVVFEADPSVRITNMTDILNHQDGEKGGQNGTDHSRA